MKKITVEISTNELIDSAVETINEQVVNNIIKLLQDEKFINYIAKKLSNAIFSIAIRETSTIDSNVLSNEEINSYLSGFDIEINNNVIFIYNTSVIDTSTKNISPEKRINYPLMLSLSKLIEFGFGYTGFLNTEEVVEGWQYDVNEHGYKGWYYMDSNGQVHWTNGLEGRLVFLKLCWWIEENFKDNLMRYLKMNL